MADAITPPGVVLPCRLLMTVPTASVEYGRWITPGAEGVAWNVKVVQFRFVHKHFYNGILLAGIRFIFETPFGAEPQAAQTTQIIEWMPASPPADPTTTPRFAVGGQTNNAKLQFALWLSTLLALSPAAADWIGLEDDGICEAMRQRDAEEEDQ